MGEEVIAIKKKLVKDIRDVDSTLPLKSTKLRRSSLRRRTSGSRPGPEKYLEDLQEIGRLGRTGSREHSGGDQSRRRSTAGTD